MPLSVARANNAEPLAASVESLISALTLFTNTTLGARFLTALPAARRRELIEAIELTSHDLAGWAYLELLEPADRARTVIRALGGFPKAAKPKVAAHVTKLIRTFDAAAKTELRALAAKGGPNAKVIESALDEPS